MHRNEQPKTANMDTSLDKLLKQALELEGLILLAQLRGDKAPDMVYDLIREKAAAIGEFSLQSAPAAQTEAVAEADAPTAVDDLQAAIDNLPDDVADDDISVEFVDEDTAADQKAINEEPASAETLAVADEEETADDEPDEAPADEADADEEPAVIEVPTVAEAPEAPTQAQIFEEQAADSSTADDVPADEPADDVPTDDEEIVDNTPDDEFVDQQPDDEVIDQQPDDEIVDEKPAEDGEEPIFLDEALQRNMTKDLRHAFSLNDRYRYRRELFGNSDSVMNETLNLIDSMSTFEEAEDYLYNDINWNHDSPEVADFMVIIKNHFWNKRQQQ